MRRLAISLALAALAALAATGSAAPAARAAATCDQVAPAKLRFERGAGRTFGRLRWSAPAAPRGTAYRVWRDRDVVGQTKGRSMRVNVRIGTAYKLRVAPVRNGRPLPCGKTKKLKIAYRLPTRPEQLAVEVADGTARLTWNASKRGDGRLAGYRVLRDGAVVKQTRDRRLQAPMGGKQQYVFNVVAVDSNGRLSKRSKQVTVRRNHQPPTAPADLGIDAVTESEVTLSWRASQGRGATIRGYRVLRNGSPVGQFATASARISRLKLNTEYTFAAQAVDSLGYVSAASATVRARTGSHAAPSAPTGVTARVISDSAVELSWQPSSAVNGRVVGYRVSRDGTPVVQRPESSVTLTNLASSTDYRFTVQAADNHGALSPPAEVQARTHDPLPTSGHAIAFLLASTDRSFHDFQAHYQQIGAVSPTYFDCSSGASLTGRDDPLITGWARARAVKVLPRFNCQRTDVLNRILNEPALRAAWVDRIMALVNESGYDGAMIDFEAGLASDRNAYTAFSAELASRLHAQGKLLMMAVSAKTWDAPNHPRSTFFDYIELSKFVDKLFVMGWGVHWATSSPGAQDDITWVREVVDYIATMPDPRRFVLGMQLYAMDWPSGGGSAHPASSYEHADTLDLIARTGASPAYDGTSDALHFSYTDGSGAGHDVWYTDATTEGRRIDLARSKGLGGVGFWRLGSEDQRLWEHPALQPGFTW